VQPFIDPFPTANFMPLAACTDPEGFAQVIARRKRADARVFRRLCPVAAQLADELAAKVNRLRWGTQGLRGDTGWSEFTAGEWRQVKCRGTERWTRAQPMSADDILASFVRPDRFAVGNCDVLEDKGTSSACVRLDVDTMTEPTFETLRAIESAGEAAAQTLGLECLVRTTGGNGAALDFRLPRHMGGPALKTVAKALRSLVEPLLPPGAKLDKDSASSLMRLPLMRNAKTGRIGLYLRNGRALPLEDQLRMAVESFTPTAGDDSERGTAALLELCRSVVPEAPEPQRRDEPKPQRRTSKHEEWEALRASRPEPGAFHSWLTYRLVYAFVWLHGRKGARGILHGIADDVPCRSSSELRERHRLVDATLDKFVMFDGKDRSLNALGTELSLEDEHGADEYYSWMLEGGVRSDTAQTYWLICRAWLHARAVYGPNADSGDAWRVACAMYGCSAFSDATVERCLSLADSLSPRHIYTLISSPFEPGGDVFGGGYVAPTEWSPEAQVLRTLATSSNSSDKYERPLVYRGIVMANILAHGVPSKGVDVETRQFKFYEFFAGGGMARLGLGDRWECILANDFSRTKAEAYRANFSGEEFHEGDVALLSPDSFDGTAALAWASFPCQDLSLAGARGGLKAERSGTFWEFWKHISRLADSGSAIPIVVVENVVGLLTSHKGNDFRELLQVLAPTYRFGALVADAVHWLPQSRPRLFIIAVAKSVTIPTGIIGEGPRSPWHTSGIQKAYDGLPEQLRHNWLWWDLPEPEHRSQTLADVLLPDDEVAWDPDSKTESLLAMMSPANIAKVKRAQASGLRVVGSVYKRTRPSGEDSRVQRAEVRFDGVSGCLRTPRGGSSRMTIIVVDGDTVRTRLLAPREAARLMGLPDAYKLPERYNQAYHLAGDGVAVPVVDWLARHLLTPIAETLG
jgi:DNA (cytosine-5)-methyltransferase 1